MPENIDDVVEKIMSQLPSWKKILSARDVAKMLKRSDQWVYDAIECGELKAVNVSLGGVRPRWAISVDSVQEFLKNRDKAEQ